MFVLYSHYIQSLSFFETLPNELPSTRVLLTMECLNAECTVLFFQYIADVKMRSDEVVHSVIFVIWEYIQKSVHVYVYKQGYFRCQ